MMEDQKKLTKEEKKEFETINENFNKATSELNKSLDEVIEIAVNFIEEQEKLKNND